MNEIKRINEIKIKEVFASAIVQDGVAVFDLTYNTGEAILKVPYLESIEVKTNNTKFDYIFDDCVLFEGNKKLSLGIKKLEKQYLKTLQTYSKANNVKVYLSMRGEGYEKH